MAHEAIGRLHAVGNQAGRLRTIQRPWSLEMSLTKSFDPGSRRRRLSAWPGVRVIPLFAILCSCGGGDGGGGSETASVYASLDSIQCGTVNSPLSSLSSKLTAAGVTVVTSSCGIDGLARAAVCGLQDGSIGIFSIPASQKTTAMALGFAPLGNLPTASVSACPAGGS
jgi:hypothetical protein